MHSWYYDRPATPTHIAGLSNRQRSERAEWQASIQRGLAEAVPVKKKRFRWFGQWSGLGPVESFPPRTVRPAC